MNVVPDAFTDQLTDTNRAPGTSLAAYTTLRLGGPAGTVTAAVHADEAVATVRNSSSQGRPVLVLAGGSNVVVGDAGFAGEVLLLPDSAGSLGLPPLEYPYFDPSARTYREATVPGMVVPILEATPGANRDPWPLATPRSDWARMAARVVPGAPVWWGGVLGVAAGATALVSYENSAPQRGRQRTPACEPARVVRGDECVNGARGSVGKRAQFRGREGVVE